jgi:hypothetical protein
VLVGTLLGDAVAVQVRGSDYVAVAGLRSRARRAGTALGDLR